jgi:hypothetical protein
MKNPCEKQEIRLLSQIGCCILCGHEWPCRGPWSCIAIRTAARHFSEIFVVVTGHTLPTAKTKFHCSGHRSHCVANQMKWYSIFLKAPIIPPLVKLVIK